MPCVRIGLSIGEDDVGQLLVVLLATGDAVLAGDVVELVPSRDPYAVRIGLAGDQPMEIRVEELSQQRELDRRERTLVVERTGERIRRHPDLLGDVSMPSRREGRCDALVHASSDAAHAPRIASNWENPNSRSWALQVVRAGGGGGEDCLAVGGGEVGGEGF